MDTYAFIKTIFLHNLLLVIQFTNMMSWNENYASQFPLDHNTNKCLGGYSFIKAALSFVSVHKHLIRMWIPSICFNLSCPKLRHRHVQINQSMEMLEFKSAEQRHTIKYFLYVNNTAVPINWCIIPWDYALLKLMVTAVVSQSTGHSFPDLFLQLCYFQ